MSTTVHINKMHHDNSGGDYAHAVNAQFDRVMRARAGMLRGVREEGLGSISGKQKSKKQKGTQRCTHKNRETLGKSVELATLTLVLFMSMAMNLYV